MSFYKPPLGTKPLAIANQLGLQGLYILNENTGNIVNDSMGKLNLQATGFGSTNPWGVGSQVGVKLNTAGSYIGASAANFTTGWPISFYVSFRYISSIAATTPFGVVANNTFSSPYYCWGFYFGGAEYMVLRWNGNGTAYFAGNTAPPVVGDNIVSVTITTKSYLMYWNGSPYASGTGTYANPLYYATSTIGSGVLPGTTGNPGIITYAACWSNTVWSAQTHAWLGSNINNIYSIFPQPKPALFSSQPCNSILTGSLF